LRLRKSKSNLKLSKTEQVFRELFPPNIGDFVEFVRQYGQKHRTMRGYVKAIRTDKRGVKIYFISPITFCVPKPRWGRPMTQIVKGYSRLRKLDPPKK